MSTIENFNRQLDSHGIYRIRNLESDQIYLGATSTSFRERWAAHKFQLQRGCHHCRRLQEDWNRLGIEWFRFEIVEIVISSETLKEREEYHLRNTVRRGIDYNSRFLSRQFKESRRDEDCLPRTDVDQWPVWVERWKYQVGRQD